jgi:hypothetical protein
LDNLSKKSSSFHCRRKGRIEEEEKRRGHSSHNTPTGAGSVERFSEFFLFNSSFGAKG